MLIKIIVNDILTSLKRFMPFYIMLVILFSALTVAASRLSDNIDTIFISVNIGTLANAVISYPFYAIFLAVPITALYKKLHGKEAAFWLTLPTSYQCYLLSAFICGILWYAMSCFAVFELSKALMSAALSAPGDGSSVSFHTTGEIYNFSHLICLELVLMLSMIIHCGFPKKRRITSFVFMTLTVLCIAALYIIYFIVVNKLFDITSDSGLRYTIDIVFFLSLSLGLYLTNAILLKRFELKC